MVCVDVFIFFLASYGFSDASRASTPSQVVTAEAQAQHTSHTSVAEIALEASQDGSDKESEVRIFAKHLEGQL